MRIAVAGAGAVGRSVAAELVDNGHKVLLIEREFTRYVPARVPGAVPGAVPRPPPVAPSSHK